MSNNLQNALEKLRQAEATMYTMEGDKADRVYMLIREAAQEITEFREMLYDCNVLVKLKGLE